MASSGSGAGDRPKVFQQQLPQQTASVKVGLPRGVKIPVSARVAGQITNCASRRFPVKNYAVTVQPNGRCLPAVSDGLEHHRVRTVSPRAAAAAADASHPGGRTGASETVAQRLEFREERVKRVLLDGHFPVLVAPSLVPAWTDESPGDVTGGGKNPRATATTAMGSRRGALVQQPAAGRASRPTIAQWRKRRPKLSTSFAAPWNSGGVAGAAERMCDRRPALWDDRYRDPVACVTREEEKRDNWMSETPMLPVSRADANVCFEAGRPVLVEHIQSMKERGRVFAADLQGRYEEARDEFQETLPVESSFDRYVESKRSDRSAAPWQSNNRLDRGVPGASRCAGGAPATPRAIRPSIAQTISGEFRRQLIQMQNPGGRRMSVKH